MAALLAIFMAQNASSVELHFLVWSVAMSQALLVFFVLVAGMLIGWTAHAFVAFRRRHRKSGTPPPSPDH